MLHKIREYPPTKVLSIKEARYPDEVNQQIIKFLFGIYTTPGLEEPRQILHSMMRNIEKDKPAVPEGARDYDGLEGMILHAVLGTFSTFFGFGPPHKLPNDTVAKIYPIERFDGLVEQVKVWGEQDKSFDNGITLGSYDPPHVGHTLDIAKIYPYTNRVMVGVEPDWSINRRKSKPGDERPRFPYVMWRMWQFAILPIVDAVFEVPISPSDNPNTFYPDLYKKLNLRIQGTEKDHELLRAYERNMEQVGGQVLLTNKSYAFLRKFVNFR